MSWPAHEIRAALQAELGTQLEIARRTAVAGGDINQAARLETSDGVFFVKWNGQAPAGLFAAEAAGLRALSASGTRLIVPEVISWSDPGPDRTAFLVTEWLEDRSPPIDRFDEDLGEGLAELHRATQKQFGFSGDNYLGTTPQPNPNMDRWTDFYRDHRIAHQVRLARSRGRLTANDAKACDRLCEHLDEWLTEAAPALLHGDLWAGNLHRHAGRPALIDPAAYFGHPEAELGMMTLFGGFSAATYDAYAGASNLSPDWRERQPLYQLYHLLNHANLFGGAYASQSMRIVRRYVG